MRGPLVGAGHDTQTLIAPLIPTLRSSVKIEQRYKVSLKIILSES